MRIFKMKQRDQSDALKAQSSRCRGEGNGRRYPLHQPTTGAHSSIVSSTKGLWQSPSRPRLGAFWAWKSPLAGKKCAIFDDSAKAGFHESRRG